MISHLLHWKVVKINHFKPYKNEKSHTNLVLLVFHCVMVYLLLGQHNDHYIMPALFRNIYHGAVNLPDKITPHYFYIFLCISLIFIELLITLKKAN